MTIQIVPCPTCQGEGSIYRTGIVYEPGCGHPHMGDVYHGICGDCHGAGVVEEEAAPATLADLDQEDYDELQAELERAR